ncbi:MAG: elongation factor P [Desulfomicrobium sp.]|jgi:elongation factor P|nr:elongation factor P [Desulfomicrobium sp.]NLV97579.1 elongation factor P [Desulfovibrionales bacterium]
MIATSEFKKGRKLEIDGAPCEILECSHYKPGKGGAFMRTKYRNLLTGAVVETNFRSGLKFPRPDLEVREMQYLYNEGDGYAFMDMTTYDQISMPTDIVGDKGGFLKEASAYRVMLYEGRPLDLELSGSVVLEVTMTDPGVKGDTVTGATKPATLETGLVVNVPLFIEEGNMIKVNTDTGEYLGRE